MSSSPVAHRPGVYAIPPFTPAWRAANEAHLSAALAALHLRLALTAQVPDVTANAQQRAEADQAAQEAGPERPALLLLAEIFGLCRFEQDVLLLCVALELDPQIGRLCGILQDNPDLGFPTFALAMAIFEAPSWEIVSEQATLRRWRLIDVHASSVQPLFLSPLRADMRVIHFLKGINQLDANLTSLVTPLETWSPDLKLADSQAQIADRIAHVIDQAGGVQGHASPPLLLLGADPADKHQVALDVCAELGLTLYRLSTEQLAAKPDDVDHSARLWQRETRLLPLALYIELDEIAEAEAPAVQSSVRRFLSQIDAVCFISERHAGIDLDRPPVAFDIAKPTPVEQRQSWQTLLGAGATDIPAQLAGQFNLGLPALHTTFEQAQMDGGPEPIGERLWDACLATTRPRLDMLAQRLDPRATWDDIVLPSEAITLLRQIADQVPLRARVYDEGGFRQRMNRGLGISALFAGPSGTGKTMTAEVLANALRLNLYRIDLSAVVNKYIGETEKNLRRLFDAAEDGGAILFFDEADALFGKRSEVKDSHDRYANIEVNYLLQRLESFQGLAILATNRKEALDSAFLRRLRFLINFPTPSVEDRVRLWQQVFPAETTLADLDYQRLGRFNLTGGNIHSIALNAAFLAAHENSAVTMAHVLDATRIEHRKLDRPINENAFR